MSAAVEWSPGAAGPVLKLVPDLEPARPRRAPRGTLNRLIWPDARELAWQDLALCAETDPEAFFPEKGGSTREAKKVCWACDVRAECLDYALNHDERFGIWGGLSERERRQLKRKEAG